MNLIELENLVKGVPDDYLTKEVQSPSGQIPPFLALSEIQRRKDMRDRYQAQQGAVQKPTIAEQLTGGIGAMQPQGAPAPAAPGGMGAPPVAAGAAPMPTPPGQPQGFAAGGQVGYSGGGFTGGLTWMNHLDPEKLKAQMAMATDPATKAAIAERLDLTTRPGIAPPPLLNAPVEMNIAASSLPVAPGQTSAAPAPAAPRYTVARGGIGNIPIPSEPPETVAGSAEEQEYLRLLKNKEGFALPEAINYDEFIAAAGEEEAAIRAAAKQEALGAALVQLGAGLASGNMAAGFAEAGAQAQQIQKEGRRDAAAQRALGQELKLRGMEGQREQAIQQMNLEMERVGKLAEFAGGTRREKEDKAFKLAEMRQRAQSDAAQLEISRENQRLNRQQYDLSVKTNAFKFRNEMLESIIGPPPSDKRYEEWQKARASFGDKAGPDPYEAYDARRKQVLPEVNRLTQETYKVSVGPTGEPTAGSGVLKRPSGSGLGPPQEANSPAEVAKLKALGYKTFISGGVEYKIQ